MHGIDTTEDRRLVKNGDHAMGRDTFSSVVEKTASRDSRWRLSLTIFAFSSASFFRLSTSLEATSISPCIWRKTPASHIGHGHVRRPLVGEWHSLSVQQLFRRLGWTDHRHLCFASVVVCVDWPILDPTAIAVSTRLAFHRTTFRGIDKDPCFSPRNGKTLEFVGIRREAKNSCDEI